MMHRQTIACEGGRKAGRRVRRALAAVLLCPLLLAASPALAETVSAVEVRGLATLDEGPVRDLIGISRGDDYSPAAVAASVARLRKWGVFGQIETREERSPGGVALVYDLTEAMIVLSVDISGNYPYIENKIRKYLTLHPGDPYTTEDITEQIDRIKEFYTREGYVGTEVAVEEEPRLDENGVELTFHIQRGDLYRYRSIEVEGNRAYPLGRYVSEINPYRAYSERRLRSSLRELREFYQSKGYPRIHIGIARKEVDDEARRIDLGLTVSEGPHVEIAFDGKTRVSRRSLKKAVTIFEAGVIDPYELDESAESIRTLLVDRGYPEAKVAWSRKDRPDGSILITFKIDAGPSRRITRLRFEGNRDLSGKELRSGMQNKQKAFQQSGAYDPSLQGQDDEVILTAMRRKGYLEGSVAPWEVTRASSGQDIVITIPVEEGPQTIVGDVIFENAPAFDAKRLLAELKVRPGKPLDEPALPDDRKRLLAFYADHGHPYASAKQSFTISPETGKATIRYEVNEGPFTRIGSILIVGDVLTSQKAIRSAMELRENDPFSARKLLESQLNIRRLGPFSFVSIETIGLEEGANVVHLKVKVEEERPFLVDLGLSYSTDERLVGTLSFSNINAFGWAKTNTLKLTGGQRLSRAELSWLDPRFLGTGVEMSTSGWIQYKERPTYAYTQLGGGFGWAKRFARFGFFTRYELDRNYFVEGDSTAADADSLRDNTISRIALSANYDTRDSFSDPTRGFYTMGGVDFYDEIKGNQANFVKFTWQGEADAPLLRRITLSTALRANYIETIGENVSVPTNELLFLGGDDTVRGFAEDSLGPVDLNGNATGGRARFIINEELRLRLFRPFSIAAFFDMGALANSVTDIGWSTFRKSAGIGLRYLTPVGPIRLDYGFKLDRKPGESIGRLHFTFGYMF